MKSKIIFRVQNLPGTGLGHLVRSISVARALAEIDIEASFILDRSWPSELEDSKPNPQNILVLGEINELQDQRASLSFAKLQKTKFLYVDSYEINSQWYELMNEAGIELIKIIDNLNQLEPNAYCIPYGIRFLLDRSKHSNPLEQVAINNAIVEWEPKIDFRIRIQNSPVNVLLYLGAEPKVDLIDLILPKILRAANSSVSKINLTIMVQKSQIDGKRNLFTDSDYPSVHFIEFTSNFHTILEESDLILASASNIIYEAAALNIPLVTFPTNRTQENLDFQMESIGHFYNLSSLSDFDDPSFPLMFQALINNHDRFQNLTALRKYQITSNGSKKIASTISMKLKNVDLKDSFALPKPVDPSVLSASNSALEFRAVTDEDVNLVLEGRNSSESRKFMVNQTLISKPAHYFWWLSKSRDDFIGEIDTVPIIYIWHQVIQTSGREFLIGGWFPLVESVHVTDILKSLHWQIAISQKKFPGIPWIATIHTDNKVTASLAMRIGFREVKSHEVLYSVISQHFFPEGGPGNFNLYCKE